MKYIFIIASLIILLSCTSQKVVKENKCHKFYESNFTEILNEEYKTVYKQDTLSFNEIRFECVYSALYTHKVMYDKFGKWNKEIFPSNRKHPILLWENVDLFSNGKKYIVMTNGLEEWKHIYASVMVFDNNGIDLLLDSSTEKDAITFFFADLIKNLDNEKKDFYEVYWKIVNSNRWEQIKQYNDK